MSLGLKRKDEHVGDAEAHSGGGRSACKGPAQRRPRLAGRSAGSEAHSGRHRAFRPELFNQKRAFFPEMMESDLRKNLRAGQGRGGLCRAGHTARKVREESRQSRLAAKPQTWEAWPEHRAAKRGVDLTNTPEQKLTECDEGLAMEDKTKRLKRNVGKGVRKGNLVHCWWEWKLV